MLRYREGACTLAGTNVTDPVIFRTTELTLQTLQDAGFSLCDAARAVPAVLQIILTGIRVTRFGA